MYAIRSYYGRETITVGLPAGGTGRRRWFLENVLELPARLAKLGKYLRARHARKPILPTHMIVTMDPHLVAMIAGAAHDPGIASCDVGTRQQHTVH